MEKEKVQSCTVCVYYKAERYVLTESQLLVIEVCLNKIRCNFIAQFAKFP